MPTKPNRDWSNIETKLAADLKHLRKLVSEPQPPAAAVRELQKAAKGLCGHLDGIDAVRESVRLAIIGLHDEAWTDVALLLFGLTDDTFATSVQERRHLAASRYREIRDLTETEYSDETFRKRAEEQLIQVLAGTLSALLAESESSQIREPDPIPEPANAHAEPTEAETTEPSQGEPAPRRRLVPGVPNDVVLSLVGALLIVGVMAWVAESSPVPPRPSRVAEALRHLTAAANLNLTGSEAPHLPSDETADQLGFGDPEIGGRHIYLQQNDGSYELPSAPTLNSLVGSDRDERRFLEVEASLSTDGHKSRSLTGARAVRAGANEIVWLFVRVYNDDVEATDCTTEGVALGTRLYITDWYHTDTGLQILRAWISADNTSPSWVTDAVAILAPPFVELVPDGSISRETSEAPSSFFTSPLISNVQSVMEEPGLLIGDHGAVDSCGHNGYSFTIGFRQTPVTK